MAAIRFRGQLLNKNVCGNKGFYGMSLLLVKLISVILAYSLRCENYTNINDKHVEVFAV